MIADHRFYANCVAAISLVGRDGGGHAAPNTPKGNRNLLGWQILQGRVSGGGCLRDVDHNGKVAGWRLLSNSH
jgi:hypothetical protein